MIKRIGKPILPTKKPTKEKMKKQEAHGHIAHLRKQFKAINTYDYIIILIKRRKKALLTLS